MRFGILGPVEIELDGRVRPLGGLREVRALALLLLSANRTVSAARLVDGVWGANTPAAAETQLRNVIYRLRRTLGGDADAIVAAGGGYRMAVAEGELDAAVFDTLVNRADGEARHKQLREAAATLREALALWRGPALSGLDGELLESAATRLNERRLAVQSTYAAHLLDLGEHEQAAAELTAVAAEHPLREDLVARLMTALYRCGRQADALDLFSDTRDLLSRELGLDPGPALTGLHLAILARDPVLAAPMRAESGSPAEASAGPPPAAAAGPSGSAEPRPFQLPPSVPGFVGRQVACDRLTALAAASGGTGENVIALTGPAGVGKTALAVHWAGLAAERFPDGVLMADLHGFDPAGDPADPAEILERFLRALGVTAEAVPTSRDERAALLRTALAGRRMLIVLDNAARADQVRPLLAGSAPCLTLVTSRDMLSGLVARDGAVRVVVDPLPEEESRTLLTRPLGTAPAAPAASDSPLVSTVLRRCGGLPLALRIAGERLARGGPEAFPQATADDGAGADDGSAFGELDFLGIEGDQAATLTSVFSWSYRSLSADAARVLRFVGLLAPDDITPPAAAALCALEPKAAQAALHELVDVNLMTKTARDRYRPHDLIRVFGAHLGQSGLEPAEQDAAAGRIAAWYLHSAAAASELLMPGRREIVQETPPPWCPAPAAADDAQALDWCESESHNFAGVLRTALAHGHAAEAWHIAIYVTSFYLRAKYWSRWQAVCELGLDAARAAQDRAAEAQVCNELGIVFGDSRRYRESIDCFSRAVELQRGLGDLNGEATALSNLSGVHHRIKDYGRAVELLTRARDLHARAGDDYGVAITLTNLGGAAIELGRTEDALGHLEASLRLLERLDNKYVLGMVLDTYGKALQAADRPDEALEHHRAALRIFRELQDEYNEAGSLHLIGTALLKTGRAAQGSHTLRAALAIFERIGAADSEEAQEIRALLAAPAAG